MTSQSSFPTPSDVRRHRGPRRATFGSIKVASIRLHEFRHVADHEFVKIIFTHRDISGMLGGFFGNTEHIHFFWRFPRGFVQLLRGATLFSYQDGDHRLPDGSGIGGKRRTAKDVHGDENEDRKATVN